MRPHLLTSLLCLTAALPSCRAGDETPATAPSAAVEPAAPPPQPELPLIDLLYRTKARVAVSSTVANAKDAPEHLIDRRPETAWNGKTGDLAAHVTFRVPATARVRQMVITPGYDKVSGRVDLFRANRRLQQIGIEREGALVGTFDLDPDDRRPQTIAVDQPGGTFVLRPVKTVPGDRPAWREIVISELAVIGTAPEGELLPEAMPQVTVGDLDPSPLRTPGAFAALDAEAPFPNAAAYCARVNEIEARELPRLRAQDPHDDELASQRPSCGADVRPFKDARLSPPFLGVALVHAVQGRSGDTRLGITTDRGFYSTDVVFSSDQVGPRCLWFSDYSIASARVDTPRPGAAVLVVRANAKAIHWGSDDNYDAAGELFISCALGADGAPRCRMDLVASTDGDDSWVEDMRTPGRWSVMPPRWDWMRAATVDDEGGIRLGPCLDGKARAIACTKHNADLLSR